MAKAKKTFTIKPNDFMNKYGDEDFVLVAMPQSLIKESDIIRDAVITYMPGYNKSDFKVLRCTMEWLESIEELVCRKSNE